MCGNYGNKLVLINCQKILSQPNNTGNDLSRSSLIPSSIIPRDMCSRDHRTLQVDKLEKVTINFLSWP